ncbi:MAG: hypothetical protein ACREVN_01865 [Gammaproteobacteria bacterium]
MHRHFDMQDKQERSPRSTEEKVNFLVAGLFGLIAIVVALQRPFDWRNTLAALGFTVFCVAWTGMYSRLKSELPDHPLARASLYGFRLTYRGRRKQRLLPWRIIRFHFERHRLDLWSTLLIAGLLMLIGTIPIRFGD